MKKISFFGNHGDRFDSFLQSTNKETVARRRLWKDSQCDIKKTDQKLRPGDSRQITALNFLRH